MRLVALLAGGLLVAATARPAPFRFVDVAAEAGLDRVLLAGRPDKDHLLDSAGHGAAWLDYDGDGDMDVFLVNGWLLDGDRVVERGRFGLYRNEGDGRFEDVTGSAGVDGAGRWGSGVAVADVDGNGWADVLVTAFGENLLYVNRGDGTFAERAAASGLAAPGWNTGAAFLDADGDGDLDVYIARYVDCTLEDVRRARPTLNWQGLDQVAMGPFGLPGGRDSFFVNDGSGRFREATSEHGLEDRGQAFGFGVLAGDLTGDGLPDLYVANDSDANYLYRNEGKGRFRETGLWSGSAVDANGAAQAGMGVASGDADGDGRVDLVVTNFAEDFTTLYRGDGSGFFDDVSGVTGVGPATFPSLSWGVVLADLDQDGDLDLGIANGHIYPQVDRHPEVGVTYRQSNQLLENRGDGTFADVTRDAGPGFRLEESSRALSVGDADDDGDLDLLISNLDARASLLRNDSASGAWLGVVLATPPGNPPVVGARVEARGRVPRAQEVGSSASFLSVHDPRPHFGLGDASMLEALTVQWPEGERVRFRRLAVDRRYVVRRDLAAPSRARPGAGGRR